MKKILPFIYIIIGVLIIYATIRSFLLDKDTYRVLFGFHTENKFIFLAIRSLFAGWFLVDGLKKLKALKEDE
ncbi:hypothetical protein SAMN04489761_0016 [Tenacibaculum sp. MAR_2009_124]|uniref:hypothetical protein n=1 Tax=Tenacibaculum sp. MAR_2009_124 TaxID=1250059 RepID=UPI00089AC51F|nr:hypothetical protein [Tenacibaculum sp. MAR_2009_124]SEB35050.1 hypothetical protein SAMN04489761_0016 [Tenacibaculum sp. MAR_2009_124]